MTHPRIFGLAIQTMSREVDCNEAKLFSHCTAELRLKDGGTQGLAVNQDHLFVTQGDLAMRRQSPAHCRLVTLQPCRWLLHDIVALRTVRVEDDSADRLTYTRT